MQNPTEFEHGQGRADTVEEPTKPIVLFVNVYALFRAYGGPEEGGWYYDQGHPSGISATVRGFHPKMVRNDAEEVQKALAETFPEGQYWTGEDGYRVLIEEHEACEWPAERPHYE